MGGCRLEATLSFLPCAIFPFLWLNFFGVLEYQWGRENLLGDEFPLQSVTGQTHGRERQGEGAKHLRWATL